MLPDCCSKPVWYADLVYQTAKVIRRPRLLWSPPVAEWKAVAHQALTAFVRNIADRRWSGLAGLGLDTGLSLLIGPILLQFRRSHRNV